VHGLRPALDKEGKRSNADLYEAVMRSHARLTYDRWRKRSPASPIRKIGPFWRT